MNKIKEMIEIYNEYFAYALTVDIFGSSTPKMTMTEFIEYKKSDKYKEDQQRAEDYRKQSNECACCNCPCHD